MTLIAPVPLDDGHLLDEFTSGTASLDDWLRRRARANHESGASRTFVLCDDARVIAYYSLASSSIACAEAVGRFRRNMPDPIPVITLARLAIDQSIHGKGVNRHRTGDRDRHAIGDQVDSARLRRDGTAEGVARRRPVTA